MSAQNNPPAKDPSAVPVILPAEFGSKEWYATRWQGHRKALIEEIGRLERALGLAAENAIGKIFQSAGNSDANDDHLGKGGESQPGESAPDWKPTEIDNADLPWSYIFLKYVEAETIALSLRTYAMALFDFFYDGFYPTAKVAENDTKVDTGVTIAQPSLQNEVDRNINVITQILDAVKEPLFYASKRYSPNFVLRSLIEQSYHDLNLLQQVTMQRADANKQTVNTLLMAEELGRRALAPATATLFDMRDRNVLCYLENRLEVRLLPYHDVVLMGAPHITNVIFSEARQQWMLDPIALTAIPHEIGHVVYRFGQVPLAQGKVAIYQLLKNRLYAKPSELTSDDWRFQWLEEIFADAYGCLVAGPISVLGFQVMLADGPPQHVRKHLGDHPIPVLRPLLQSQILRKIPVLCGNPRFPEAPALLDARWQRWVVANWPHLVAEKWLGEENQSDIIGDIRFEIAGQMMTGQKILAALEPVIDVVLKTLQNVYSKDKASTWTPEWEPTADTQNLTGLYNEFVGFAESVADGALPTAEEAFQRQEHAQPSRTLPDLLRQFEAEGIDGWRARSGGIDSLIEMILFDSWSEEGPRAQNEQ